MIDHDQQITPDVVTGLTISGVWREFVSYAVEREFNRILRLLDGTAEDDFIQQIGAFWNDFYTPALTGGSTMQIAIVEHREASGVDGGGLFASTWTKRPITNVASDPDGIVSVASDEITLQAGSYLIDSWGTAFQTAGSQIRIRDVNTSTVYGWGSSDRVMTSQFYTIKVRVSANIIVASPVTIAIEQFATSGNTSDGLGFPVGAGNPEIYSQTIVKKYQ